MRQRSPRVVPGLAALGALLILAPAASAKLTAVAGGDDLPGKSRIVIAGNDGSDRRTLTAGEFAAVSPDGGTVAVVDSDYDEFKYLSTRLKVLPAAGGKPSLAVPLEGAFTVDAVRGGARRRHRGVMATGLSHDGKFIIGQTGDPSTSGFTGGKIVRMPWHGGKPRVLLRGALNASYSG